MNFFNQKLTKKMVKISSCENEVVTSICKFCNYFVINKLQNFK